MVRGGRSIIGGCWYNTVEMWGGGGALGCDYQLSNFIIFRAWPLLKISEDTKVKLGHVAGTGKIFMRMAVQL